MTTINEARFSRKKVENKWLICDPEGGVLPGFGKFDDEEAAIAKQDELNGKKPAQKQKDDEREPAMAESLHAVIQGLINEKPEDAQAAIHQYFVSKVQELCGLTEVRKDKKTVGPKYKKGDMVWLKADADEGWERQRAEIIEPQGDHVGISPAQAMYTVCIHTDDRDDNDTDGITEVSADQIEGKAK